MKTLSIAFFVLALFFVLIGHPIIAVLMMTLCALRSSNILNYYPIVEDIEEFIQFQWNINSTKILAISLFSLGITALILGAKIQALIIILAAIIYGLSSSVRIM